MILIVELSLKSHQILTYIEVYRGNRVNRRKSFDCQMFFYDQHDYFLMAIITFHRIISYQIACIITKRSISHLIVPSVCDYLDQWDKNLAVSLWSVGLKLYIYISSGSNCRSNCKYLPSWSWKESPSVACLFTTGHISSWWTYRNVSARIQVSQIGD